MFTRKKIKVSPFHYSNLRVKYLHETQLSFLSPPRTDDLVQCLCMRKRRREWKVTTEILFSFFFVHFQKRFSKSLPFHIFWNSANRERFEGNGWREDWPWSEKKKLEGWTWRLEGTANSLIVTLSIFSLFSVTVARRHFAWVRKTPFLLSSTFSPSIRPQDIWRSQVPWRKVSERLHFLL